MPRFRWPPRERRPARILAALLLVAPALTGAHPGSPSSDTTCASARARAEIAQVSAAMLAWYTDVVSAARGPQVTVPQPLCPASPLIDLSLIPLITAEDLSDLLVPFYIDHIPVGDPWNRAYEYRLNLPDILGADVLAVRTRGSDGVFEGLTYDHRFTSGPEDDLLFFNDAWVRDLPRLDPVSRQRLTVEQVRDTGAALYAWFIDVVSARPGPRGSGSPAGANEIDLTLYAPIDIVELTGLLTGTLYYYTRCVPERDGWGNPYDYRLNDDLFGFQVAAIRSLGSDGIAEGNVYPVGTFPAGARHHDILWADGLMAREPDDGGSAILLDDFESAELWGYWSCGPGY